MAKRIYVPSEARRQQAFEQALQLASLIREKTLAQECEESLKTFLRESWATTSPGTPFSNNWHLDALCEHLEALFRRDIRRLIINICPRSYKSGLISVAAPAWRWLRAPQEKFASISYSRSLSLRDSRRTRALIMSQWYQARWRGKFELTRDQNEKGRFENSGGGYRLAGSIEGGILGEGGSVIILDDPNDLEKMQYPDYRQSVKDWYQNSLASRFIDPKTDVRICVQQRSSYGDDLTQFLLDLGGWEQLVIPNEFDGSRKVTSIGWSDPRTVPGELMHPERLGPEETEDLKRTMGPNYCTPAYTPILMADFSEKKIGDVQIGDVLIGYERKGGPRMRLVRSVVKNISCSVQEVFELRMESGRVVHCTKDHKWYRYFSGTGPDKYIPARVGSRLHSVYVPVPSITSEEQRLYDWLGGMIDGEGACIGTNPIIITQSARNPEIQTELSQVLDRLGFRFKKTEYRRTKAERNGGPINPKWAERSDWVINGGRSAKIKILAHCRMAKRQRIIDSCWRTAGNLADHHRGSKPNHKVVSITCLGEMPVYGLTTTTGNYIAWGFASQNSGQYNQVPASLTGGHLQRGWFNFWVPRGTSLVDETGVPRKIVVKDGNKSLEKVPREIPEAFEQVVQSWDMAFKDEAQGSKVAAQVWGRVGSNCYLLARDTKHRDFPATLHAMRRWGSEFPCPEKLVEDKANGPAVIQTLRNEIPGLIAVNPEGGKFARVAAVSGYVEAGNVWLPNPEMFPWVWDLIAELCGTPQDDTDAATQALKRLFDSQAQQGVPEFRVQPRIGEPQTACHVAREELPGWWRRYVTVLPGAGVLWMVETPTGSLRVIKEARLEGTDADTVGRLVAKGLVSSLLGEASGPVDSKRAMEIFLPKLAFSPVEPHGSWAELCETSILGFVPEEGDYDYREQVKQAIKSARIRLDQIEEDDSALDRLRGLLAFQPPDFEKVPYDRRKALQLSRDDIQAYADYMAQVEGEARGEWPKLKISPECKELISQMGGFRRDKISEAPGLVRTLLLAVCAPLKWKPSEVREQVGGKQRVEVLRPGRGNLISKRFARR